MSVGPVQLVVLGFDKPDFRGEIIEELDRLRASDTVRVIDALVVFKDADGDVAVAVGNNLTDDEEAELGGYVTALLGLDENGDDELDDIDDDEFWDVISEIPDDTAAALILLEHQWAVPLRDAVVRAGGQVVADGFISPFDLAEIGLER